MFFSDSHFTGKHGSSRLNMVVHGHFTAFHGPPLFCSWYDCRKTNSQIELPAAMCSTIEQCEAHQVSWMFLQPSPMARNRLLLKLFQNLALLGWEAHSLWVSFHLFDELPDRRKACLTPSFAINHLRDDGKAHWLKGDIWETSWHKLKIPTTLVLRFLMSNHAFFTFAFSSKVFESCVEVQETHKLWVIRCASFELFIHAMQQATQSIVWAWRLHTRRPKIFG